MKIQDDWECKKDGRKAERMRLGKWHLDTEMAITMVEMAPGGQLLREPAERQVQQETEEDIQMIIMKMNIWMMGLKMMIM